MESYVEQYILYLQMVKKTSGNTVAAYRRDLNKLMQFLKERLIGDFGKVTFTDLNSYILSLEKEGSASSTVSRNVSAIKSFFTYLFRLKIMEDDPSVNLKAPKIIKKVPEILTVEEMDKLLSLPDDSVKGIRDKAMLELLYATGLKVSELISVKLSEINTSMRYIRLTDGERERIVPFNTSAKNASITDYRKATGFEALIGFLYLMDRMDRILFLVKEGIERSGLTI